MPWTVCTVNRAGPAENNIIYIHLRATNGSFSAWFSAVDNMKKEMLATALTAITTGKSVDAFLTDTTAYSTINRLYVRN